MLSQVMCSLGLTTQMNSIVYKCASRKATVLEVFKEQ